MIFGRKRRLLEAGARVADFRLQRLAGREVASGEILSQGPALLAFFKVNCPVCQLTFPYLERIHSPEHLAIYGISQNGPEDTADFNRVYGVTFPVLLDTEASGFPVSNAFGISTVPTLFQVERDGTISRVIEGWRKSEIAALGIQAGLYPFREGESVPEAKAG
jgi:peroxiredoxin